MAENIQPVGDLFAGQNDTVNLPDINSIPDKQPIISNQTGQMSSDQLDALLGHLNKAIPEAAPKPLDIGGAIGSALYGAVNEPTLGLVGAGLKAVVPSVYEKAEQARAEHPIAYGAGGLTGIVGAGALTGGASLAEEGAAAVGEAGAESLGNRLAQMIPTNAVTKVGEAATAKMGEGLVKSVVRTGVDGALYNMGSALVQDVAVNHDKSATDVIADMGHEGLHGFLIGGAIGSLPSLGRVIQKGAEAPKTLIESDAGKELKDLYFKTVKKANNLSDEESQLMQDAAKSSYEGNDLRDQLTEDIRQGKADQKSAIEQVKEQMRQTQELHDNSINAITAAQDTIKKQHEQSAVQWYNFIDSSSKGSGKMRNEIYKYRDSMLPEWLKEVDVGDLKSYYYKNNGDGTFGGLLGDVLTDLRTQPDPNLLKTGIIKQFDERVAVATKKLINSDSSESSFKIINTMKQDIQNDLGKYGKPMNYEEKATQNLIKTHMNAIAKSLEDQTVWGEAGEFQKGLNSVYGGLATAEKDIGKLFGNKILEANKQSAFEQNIKWEPNFKKVSSWVKGQKDPQAVEMIDNAMVNWNNKMTDFHNFVSQHIPELNAPNSGLNQYLGNLSQTKQGYRQLEAYKDQLKQMRLDHDAKMVDFQNQVNQLKVNEQVAGNQLKKQQLANAERKVNELSPMGSLSSMGRNMWPIGAISHHPVIAGIGAILDGASRIIYATKNPIRLAKSISSIEKASENVSSYIKNATDKAMGINKTLPAIATGILLGQKEYSKVAQNLSKPQNVLSDRIQSDTAHFNEHNNNIVDEIRNKYTVTAQFLKAKLPVDANGNILEKPNDFQLAKFNRYYKAATNPMSVIENLGKKRVSAEEIETIKTLYPSLYQKVAQNLQTISQNKETYNDEQDLMNKWMGSPQTPSKTVQNIYSQQQQQEGGNKKPGISAKSNIVTQTQTATERLASKMS